LECPSTAWSPPGTGEQEFARGDQAGIGTCAPHRRDPIRRLHAERRSSIGLMTISDRNRLLAFMRQELYAVQASVGDGGVPQAAIVGVVVSDQFEVFFDTLGHSRKATNLRQRPYAAMVLGPAASGSAQTVQLEGLADEPRGDELARLLQLYFKRFPDGRERQGLADITYWRIRPTWIRFSDFSVEPAHIVEITSGDLASTLISAAL
jgi:hypothetical protein